MKHLKPIVLASIGLLMTASVSADELKLAHFSSTKYHLHNEMFLPLADKISRRQVEIRSGSILPANWAQVR